jgi:hypothetical protein
MKTFSLIISENLLKLAKQKLITEKELELEEERPQ